MNYFKWDDFNPNYYDELDSKFESVFFNLLPNNSKSSFKYHVKHYRYLMISKFKLKSTFSEELTRFEHYLIKHYNLKPYKL